MWSLNQHDYSDCLMCYSDSFYSTNGLLWALDYSRPSVVSQHLSRKSWVGKDGVAMQNLKQRGFEADAIVWSFCVCSTGTSLFLHYSSSYCLLAAYEKVPRRQCCTEKCMFSELRRIVVPSSSWPVSSAWSLFFPSWEKGRVAWLLMVLFLAHQALK